MTTKPPRNCGQNCGQSKPDAAMSPEAVTIEIALVQAIRLLELSVLAGEVTNTGVEILNLAATDLLKTGLMPLGREQTTDLLFAVVQLNLAVGDSLTPMRPLIQTFIADQKKLLRERTNFNAMH